MNDLKVVPAGDRNIVITRTFKASKEKIFEAYTKPEYLKRWLLGPKGWTLPVCTLDPKPGGEYHYMWRHEDGREMGMHGVVKEIHRPDHLQTTENFDEPWYPGEGLNDLSLTEDGKTTLHTVVLRYESKTARDMVLQSGMHRGLSESYDRLEDLLRII